MSDDKKGLDTFSKMFGPEYSARFIDELNTISPDFARIVGNFLVPEIWVLDKVDLKTKILCAFAALAALGRPETRTFAFGAFTQGVSREELAEIILIIVIEAGFPAALQTFRWANDAWAEYSQIKRIFKASRVKPWSRVLVQTFFHETLTPFRAICLI
jgi:4-carboxymuconolactone decarboxylase